MAKSSDIGKVTATPPEEHGTRGWRDAEIFGRLDTAIAAERSKRQQSRRTPQPKPLSSARTKELEEFVRKHIAPISEFMRKRCGPQLRHRPKALKNMVLVFVRKELPPKPRRSGRPQKAWITKAMRIKAKQRREKLRGARKKFDWEEIALVCIPGYRELRDWQRKQALKRLRNSVRAREHQQSFNLRPRVRRNQP
jgi:hypothetical protein